MAEVRASACTARVSLTPARQLFAAQVAVACRQRDAPEQLYQPLLPGRLAERRTRFTDTLSKWLLVADSRDIRRGALQRRYRDIDAVASIANNLSTARRRTTTTPQSLAHSLALAITHPTELFVSRKP